MLNSVIGQNINEHVSLRKNHYQLTNGDLPLANGHGLNYAGERVSQCKSKAS
jgi:hypothetical protein